MLAPTKDAPKCWRAHGNVPDAADAPSRRWLQSCHRAPPQVTSPAQVFQVFQKSGGGHTGSQRHSAQGFCVWWGTKVRGCHHRGRSHTFPVVFLLLLSFSTLFFCVCSTPASPPGGFPNHFCDENVRRHHRHLLLAACKPLRWLHAMECRYLHARVNRRNYPIVCCRQ